jgi:hypothetical protein
MLHSETKMLIFLVMERERERTDIVLVVWAFVNFSPTKSITH